MNCLEFKNISFAYNDIKILDNFSFNVAQNEILMIKGKSGIGKSTILKLISGIEIANNGSILLNNKDISKEKIEKRNIAYLFQEYALFPHLTVAENISYALKKNKTERVKELLKLIELENFENRYPYELSGGEKQRVALARSIANVPSIVLLDEPFSSLNVEIKNKLRLEIRNILKSLKISAIIVSHDADDEIIADRIINLEKKEI